MRSCIFSSVLLALCFIALSEATPDSNPISLVSDPFNFQNCSGCVCGITRRPRIVGGNVAERKNHPWMVRIRKYGVKYCGGSLITRRHILTAAHCVYNQSMSGFTVHLGHREYEIQNIITHARYNIGARENNDIAIIELRNRVKMSASVKTICLPRPYAEFAGKTGVAAGYGKRNETDVSNRDLRDVELPILSKSECSRTFYFSDEITNNMFCAGFIDGKKGTCMRDSGGPLEVHDGERTVLAGIVSWGVGCARKRYPGVYTKVSRYIGWIQTRISNECLCG